MSAPTQPPSIRTARALVQALVDLGVRDAVISPGSRSAPLVPVLATAEQDGWLRVRVVLDERSAGFTALGMARAALATGQRRPAAVITTSGTAVANLHPAVAEADADGVPLLVISADRPHELVGTGASQTTEQTRLFGDAPRLVVDLPADLHADLGQAADTAVAGQVRRAVEAARGTLTNDPGPAQLNLRLRPPLAPVPDPATGAVPREALALRPPAQEASSLAPAPAPVPAGQPGVASAGQPGAAAAPSPGERASHAEVVAGTGALRGLVVAGDCPGPAGTQARALAEHLGWPLLAEPTSGARGGHCALTRYAELLATPAGARLASQAEHIVVAGHPSLTRPVTALLARRDVPVDVLTPTARWTDTAGTARTVTPLPTSPLPGAGEAAPALAQALGLRPAPQDWLSQWHEAVAGLPTLPDLLAPPADGPGAAGEGLSADAVATAVWDAALQAGAPRLVVGSSMTVRRLDRLATPAQQGVPAPHPLANRGLAGIDGTLATATGAALAWGEPVRVVVGDLTFLHDAMSLGRGTLEEQAELQVVVVDDAGGAIFSTLEYPGATEPQVFERFFSTPQAADVPALGRALGMRVHEPGSLPELKALLAAPVTGASLIHVRVSS